MRRRTLVLVSVALFIASVAAAQFGRFGNTSPEAHLARPSDYDAKFHYCRAVYRPNPRGDGGGWLTDYPLADIDLSIRLSELTKIAVAFDAPHQPRHLIVQLTSDSTARMCDGNSFTNGNRNPVALVSTVVTRKNDDSAISSQLTMKA